MFQPTSWRMGQVRLREAKNSLPHLPHEVCTCWCKPAPTGGTSKPGSGLRTVFAWHKAENTLLLPQGTERCSWLSAAALFNINFPLPTGKYKRKREMSSQTSERSSLYLRAPWEQFKMHYFFCNKMKFCRRKVAKPLLPEHQCSSSFLTRVATHWDKDQIWPREGWALHCQQLKGKWSKETKNIPLL